MDRYDRTLLSVSSVFIQATGTLIIATDTSDDVAITTGLANDRGRQASWVL